MDGRTKPKNYWLVRDRINGTPHHLDEDKTFALELTQTRNQAVGEQRYECIPVQTIGKDPSTVD